MRGSARVPFVRRSVFAVVLVVLVVALGAAGCAQAGEAPMPSGADASDATLLSGRAIWIQRCARCHGPAGKGGAGPRLAGKVTATYPDVAAEIAVVSDGKGSGMPAWKNLLSEADIAAVVEYTRRTL